jgi:ABC-type lipoprotein export system ATPase subunit
LEVQSGGVTIVTSDRVADATLLLRLLGMLETPDAGTISFAGERASDLREPERATLRTRQCGYVFAAPFLLPELTVIENIAMPLFKICGVDALAAKERTEELLDFTGLQEVATKTALTPEQQHRAALARALATRPQALFVEEIDTALPPEEATHFRALLRQAAVSFSVAVVCSAGEAAQPEEDERFIRLKSGRLVDELPR